MTTGPGRRTRTRRTGVEIRERVIAAAIELMQEAQGSSEVTSRAIAARAGVQESVIQRYFGSKRGLLNAVAEANARRLGRAMDSSDDIEGSMWATFEHLRAQPDMLLNIARMTAHGIDVTALETWDGPRPSRLQLLMLAVHRQTPPNDPELRADWVVAAVLLAGMAMLGDHFRQLPSVEVTDTAMEERLRAALRAILDGVPAARV